MMCGLPKDPHLQNARVEGRRRGPPWGGEIPCVCRLDGALRGGAAIGPADELAVLKPRPAKLALRERRAWDKGAVVE